MHPPLAQLASTLRRVAGLARPCRSARLTVSHAVTRAVSQRPSSALLRVISQPPRLCCEHSQLYRGSVPGRIAAYLAIQPSGQAALLSRYSLLYRDTLPQQPGPRARTARPCARAGRVVACIVALPRRVVGVAWPYRGPCSCAQLPCVTIQSIVS